MPCTIVVGGQYGSEGKGKVVAFLSAALADVLVVRCGGPNSGHTVTVNGEQRVLQQIPAGVGHHQARLLICAGCVVDEALCTKEIIDLGISKERIVIDPRAVLLQESNRQWEKESLQHISSTCSGTGAAIIQRITRQGDVSLVQNSQILRRYATVEPVAPIVHKCLDQGRNVIVEGTQGFGLSLYHGPDYPYATSRDTTAAAFAMEVGLSPRQIDSIIMVVRTFPIRAGKAGFLPGETTWGDIQTQSGSPSSIQEWASVTRRMRRVGHFDMDSVITACQYNRPTGLAVMGLDRLDYRNSCVTSYSDLTQKAVEFLDRLTQATRVPIRIVGTGPKTENVLWAPLCGN